MPCMHGKYIEYIMHDSNKKFSLGKHKYLVQRHKLLINYSILNSKGIFLFDTTSYIKCLKI